STSRSTGPSPDRSARSPGGFRRSRPRSQFGGGALRRALKWLIGIGAGGAVVAVVLSGAAIALPRLVDTPRVQAMIAGSATQAIGRPVKFESLSVRLLQLAACERHKLEGADGRQIGTAPFLTLEIGRVYLKLRPLLGGRV